MTSVLTKLKQIYSSFRQIYFRRPKKLLHTSNFKMYNDDCRKMTFDAHTVERLQTHIPSPQYEGRHLSFVC